MKTTIQKLYCYVDESGQDTKGDLFVVGVVILENERERVLKELEQIETESGKKNVKWHKARSVSREAYMRAVANSKILENTLFFEVFKNSKEYLEMTSYATAKAIFKKAGDSEYSVTVYVDGLSKTEIVLFGKELKALNIKRKKVRGARKEENNPFIRLADALCGLVRDARDGNSDATGLLRLLQKRKTVTVL